MKYLKILPLFIVFAFIIGCEDDDDVTAPVQKVVNNNLTGYYMNANLDGQEFKAASVVGSLDSGSIFIGGLSSTAFPQMIISLRENDVPTTYTYPIDIFSDSTSAGLIYTVNDSTSYLFNSGQIVLSLNDTVNNIVEGTFQGTLYEFSFSADADSILVTNGQFRAFYF